MRLQDQKFLWNSTQVSIGFGAKCFFFFRLDCHKSESRLLVASFPGPARFVACSTKFAQRAWARSSRDVCHSRIFTSADNNVCRVAYIPVQWSFKLKQVKRVR